MAGQEDWISINEEEGVPDAAPQGPPIPSADDIGRATAQATFDVYNPPSDPQQFELARKYAMEGEGLDQELEGLLDQRQSNIPSTVERLRAARARLEGRAMPGTGPNDRLRVMAAAGAPGTWADNSSARAGALLKHDQSLYDQDLKRQAGLESYDDAIDSLQVGGVDAQIAALQKRIAERNDLRQKYMGMRPPTTSGGSGNTNLKAGLEAENSQIQVEGQSAELDQLIEWADTAHAEGVKFSGPTSWQAFSPYLGGLTEKIFGPGSREHFIRQTGGFGDELRQKAERITQLSLRPILGAQFTRVEGENMLARAYDVTKPWPVNKARLLALRSQLANLSDVNQQRIAVIRNSPEDRLTPEARLAARDLKMELERAMDLAGDEVLRTLGVRGGPGSEPVATGIDQDFLRRMQDPAQLEQATADELEVYADYLEEQAAGGAPKAEAEQPEQPKETSGVLDWLLSPGLRRAEGGKVNFADGGEVKLAQGGTPEEEEERRAQARARIQAAQAAPAPGQQRRLPPPLRQDAQLPEDIPESLRRLIDEANEPSPFDALLGATPDILRGVGAGYLGYKAKPFLTDAYNAATSNAGQRALAQGYTDDQQNIGDALANLRKRQTTYGQSGAELIDVMPRPVRDQVVAPAMAAAPAAGRELQAARQAQNDEAKTTRIPQAVISGLVADHPYEEAYKRLEDARTAAADPEFSAVWQSHPKLSGTKQLNAIIQEITESRIGKLAVRRANEEWTRLQRDGKVPPGSPVGQGPSGYGPYATQYLHKIQSHLYDLTRSTSGLDSEEARSLRSPIVEYMDAQTGGQQSPYAAARANYATHSRGMEAMEDGLSKALKMRPDEFGAMWQSLDPTQQEHMRTGIANAIDRDIANRGSDVNPAHAILNKPSTMQILEIAAGNPRRFKAMVERLEAERDSWDLAKQEAKRRVPPITAEQRKQSKGSAVDNKVTRLVAGLDRLRHPMMWFTSQQERAGEPMARKRGEQIISAARSKTPSEISRLANLQKRMEGRTRGAGLLGVLSAAAAAGAPYIGESEEERLERLREQARSRAAGGEE